MTQLTVAQRTATPLSVVIIHRRSPATLVSTVEQMRLQCPDLRFIIVDNASSPEDRATLSAIEDVDVIELGDNIGFGPAANVGLRKWLAEGEGDWCLVSPHDALVEPGCLENLMGAIAEVPRAGVASAEYGKVGHYGQPGTHVKPAVHPVIGTYLEPALVDVGWEDCAHPHGTLMALRRECLEDIGLFDERYFAYSEEADIGLRARRAGWRVGIVWGAVVQNPGMSSAPGVPEYLMQRNTLLLVRHHFGRLAASGAFLVALGVSVVATVYPPKQPLYWHRRGRWLALRDFLRGRYGPPPAGLVSSAGPRAGSRWCPARR